MRMMNFRTSRRLIASLLPLLTLSVRLAADQFTAAGTLQAARSNHTATLLADGRVLVTGGLTSFGTGLNSAEIYNPATQSSAYMQNMQATYRADHSAVRLADGRVFIVGGNGGSPGGISARDETLQSEGIMTEMEEKDEG